MQLAFIMAVFFGHTALKLISFEGEDPEFNFISVIYSGMFVFGITLCLISLFTGLNVWCFLLLVIPFYISIKMKFIGDYIKYKKYWLIFTTISFPLIILGATTQISWGDSGLYHIQSVKWIQEYGTVKGLALIHTRFGFVSLWFYLIAPFTDLLKVNNSYLLLNIFLISVGFTTITFLVWSLQLTATSISRLSLLLCLLFILTKKGILFFVFSPSPDLPLYFAIGLSLCLFIHYYSKRNLSSYWMAIFGFMIKPVIVPICIIFFIYFFHKYRDDYLKAFKLIFLYPLLVAIPFFTCRYINSGSLLFPSSTLTFDVKHSVGKERAAEEALGTTNWARGWDWHYNKGSFFQWLNEWRNGKLNYLRFDFKGLFMLAGLISSIFLMFLYRINKELSICGLILFVGILFVLVKAPASRFMFGYLYTSLSLAFAWAASKLVINIKNFGLSKKCIFGTAIGVILFISFFTSFGERLINGTKESFTTYFFQTKGLPSHKTTILKADNFAYFKAEEGNCWGHKLPTTPYKLEGVKLSNPSKGLDGGFMRSGNE